MYDGDSRQEDEAVDTVMAAVYRQLDDHDLGTDTPFDAEAGLRRLAEQMPSGDQPGTPHRSDPESGTPLGFKLLGPFQMTADEELVEPGPRREQRMLVALLEARGAPVSHARLMDAIWDDTPGTGRRILSQLAYNLRRRLAAAGDAGALIVTNDAYKLALPAERVDVHRFRALVDCARRLVVDDDWRAASLLQEALSLHRGEPLAGLRGHWIDNYRHALMEERRAAELTLYEIAIRHGESRERVPALRALYWERPDDEWAAWLLMHALYRVGRQAEALAVGRDARYSNETVAAASMYAFRHLSERILRQDDTLLRPEALRFPADTFPEPGQPSAQAAPESLTTREREIAAFVADGMSNREIASRLHISKRTVDAHIEHIFGKLGIASRVQLVVWLRDNQADRIHRFPTPGRS
jgi:DNA-binding NarL/FixJ family response regulator